MVLIGYRRSGDQNTPVLLADKKIEMEVMQCYKLCFLLILLFERICQIGLLNSLNSLRK